LRYANSTTAYPAPMPWSFTCSIPELNNFNNFVNDFKLKRNSKAEK
jgi:hypothetical protein